MYRRQFRGYLRKSKFSRLSKRYNAQPPAGIFPIYPIDDSDDLGFSVDIIIMTQSLTTHHISFNSVKASNSKPRTVYFPTKLLVLAPRGICQKSFFFTNSRSSVSLFLSSLSLSVLSLCFSCACQNLT